MKPIASFCVAMYCATQCSLYHYKKVPINKGETLVNNDSIPDASQLETLQRSVLDGPFGDYKNTLVVVPDDWLSVTEHEVDHLIPAKLAPLVALTYAAEHTFSAPEDLRLSYQQDVTANRHTKLTVVACSGHQADLFCLPFKNHGMRCLLISQGQWRHAQGRNRPWRWFARQSLVAYRPDEEKRQGSRRLVVGLLSFCLLINGMAYLGLNYWQEQSYGVSLECQKIVALQAHWLSSGRSSNGESSKESIQSVSDAMLKLTQGLPMSARLTSFEGDQAKAKVVLSVPKRELSLLLGAWREKWPTWRWDIERLSSPLDSGQEEVVDVAIFVSEV